MSVQRVLLLLQTLASPEAPLSLVRLSAALGAPKPSVLSLLNELTATGYVRRTDAGYELGQLGFRLGLQIVATDTLVGVLRSTLLDLNLRLQMTVAFGYLDPATRALIYADRYEQNGPVRYVVKLGAPLPIHSRAMGRLLLAYEPESDWAGWLGLEPYTAFTHRTVTTLAQLRPVLHRAREEGTTTTVYENHAGIGSCAVAVRDEQGEVVAGLATQTLIEDPEEHAARVLPMLRHAAEQLGKELAARGITRSTLARRI